jgi:hypothetical protein
MVFGFGKPSPQPRTMGSFPAGPPAMLVTSVPAYAAVSPCYSYPPTFFPTSPVIVPVSLPIQPIAVQVPVLVPVAVQSPVIQVPALPTTTQTTATCTVVQSAPNVPSPVCRAQRGRASALAFALARWRLRARLLSSRINKYPSLRPSL